MCPTRMIAAVAILLAAWAGPSRASPVRIDSLAPISAWNVDWSADVCTLRRSYGDPQAPDVVWLERYGPTNALELSIIGEKLKSTRDMNPIFVTWGAQPPRALASMTVWRGKTKAGRTVLNLGAQRLGAATNDDALVNRWRPPTLEDAGVTQLAVQMGHAEVVFQLGPFAKALAALHSCTENLVKLAGLDPAVQADLAFLPQPMTSPASWISPGDYPLEQVGKGGQGLVHFRLLIDAAGKPTSCQILHSLSNAVFGQVTCAKLMKRASFSPARDRNGKAVASFYVNSMQFAIFGSPPPG